MNISNTSTAKLISQSFANRERVRKETDLRRFRGVLEHEGNAPVNSKEYMLYFKELQDSGYGQIIWGPRGAPLRFIWKKNMRQTGESILNQLQGNGAKEVLPVPPPPKMSLEAPEIPSMPKELQQLMAMTERKKTGLTITEKVQFMILLEKLLGL